MQSSTVIYYEIKMKQQKVCSSFLASCSTQSLSLNSCIDAQLCILNIVAHTMLMAINMVRVI